MRVFLMLACVCLIGACTAGDTLIPVPKVEASVRIPSKFASIEVTEISLPAYASNVEITRQTQGVLTATSAVWADDPARAMTLALSRHLSEITRARVASEPWPFNDSAAGRVEVRVEELIEDGTSLRMSGQYFVVDLDDRGRDHAHLFDLSTPGSDARPGGEAAARAEIVLLLAQDIARRGL